MYNYDQIEIVYTIKKKMLDAKYWEDNYQNVFPEFQFSLLGRYVWQVNNQSSDDNILESINTKYIEDRDKLLDFLTTHQYKFLMDNITLFHSVYRIGANLVVSLI